MKEIKFRGKTPDGKWVYGYYVHLHDCRKKRDSYRIYTGFAETDVDDFFGDWHDVDPNSVSQFTGCLDKHGHEVYEGDIVDAWSAGSHCTNGLIHFAGSRFFILLNGDNGPLGPWNLAPSQYDDKDEHLKIVGNVIDNPEMVAGYLKWCKERNEKWFD